MPGLELENFEEVRFRGEELYKRLEPVYCPYFKAKVIFTAEGLEHLKFKRRGVARPRQDQYMRFKLLNIIASVLTDSKTVQGVLETKQFQKVRKHNRTEVVLLPVTFYEFIAVIDRIRVKIIVKQIERGPYIFWSIIPFWGVTSIVNKRKLYSGNLNED